MLRTRRFLVLTLLLALVAMPIGLASGQPAPRAAAARDSGGHGSEAHGLHDLTQPRYSYADAIRETVWVLGPDGDGDGHRDKVAVDIIRPRELAGNKKIPTLMDASPYYSCCGRGAQVEVKTYFADGRPKQFPLFYDNYFVPRGYAVALVDMAGTNRSTGCVDEGYRSDVMSVRAAIRWLNHRGRAVNAAGSPVRATWSAGRVGMIGKSYDGTLANGVASTGVAGLRTIVPISAISSWYDYDRGGRLPFAYDYPAWLAEYVMTKRVDKYDCSATLSDLRSNDADQSGAYTKFWHGRDYRRGQLGNAAKVRASVFAVHGLQDTNVKTPNVGHWWNALVRHHVTTKLWLSRTGHVDPFDYDRARWVHTLHAWFDNQLMGRRTGVLDQPRVRVQLRPGQWAEGESWPLGAKRRLGLRPGRLVNGASAQRVQTFVNDPQQSDEVAVKSGKNKHRLLFVSGRLAHAVRLSGQPTVTLRMRREGKHVGQVAVLLVDYGSQRRVLETDDGIGFSKHQSCWGAAVAYDDGCYPRGHELVGRTPLSILARGWARLAPGAMRTVRVPMAFNDVPIRAGHRLGVVVQGVEKDWTVVVDPKHSRYRVSLQGSSVQLPLTTAPRWRATAGRQQTPDASLPSGSIAPPPGRLIPQ